MSTGNNPGKSFKKMNMIRFALAMLAIAPPQGAGETDVITSPIALASYGGNPEAGNHFRSRNSSYKKTNRLHCSRKAKIRRRKA